VQDLKGFNQFKAVICLPQLLGKHPTKFPILLQGFASYLAICSGTSKVEYISLLSDCDKGIIFEPHADRARIMKMVGVERFPK
jgi:hypothetical protein